MPQIIKKGRVVNDDWHMVAEELTLSADEAGRTSFVPKHGDKYLLPPSLWNTFFPQFSGFSTLPGLLLDNQVELEEIKVAVSLVPIIAISFSSFMDGTGFSTGALLRERFSFSGELRACGAILPDQVNYLMRCGFDSVAFNYPHSVAQYQEIQAQTVEQPNVVAADSMINSNSDYSSNGSSNCASTYASNYQGDVSRPKTPFQRRFGR